MPALRILLADDHPGFRAGLEAHLHGNEAFDIVGLAMDGQQALDMAIDLHPDVVVLDMEMPRLSGLETTTQLTEQAPEIAILMLSAYDDDDYVVGALDAGAAGYLAKDETLDSIAEAIHAVGTGQTGWLSRRIAARFAGRRAVPYRAQYDVLSDREQQVAQQAAQGLTNEEIASQLYVSVSTVKKHLNACFAKLSLSSRAQLLVWMWRNGLVEEQKTQAEEQPKGLATSDRTAHTSRRSNRVV